MVNDIITQIEEAEFKARQCALMNCDYSVSVYENQISSLLELLAEIGEEASKGVVCS